MKKTVLMLLAGIVALACSSPAKNEMEAKIDAQVAKMSLREKAGQLVQLEILTMMDESGEHVDEGKLREAFRTWKIGSILNVIGGRAHSAAYTAEEIAKLQKISMEELGIPCLYGLDMIHGATYISDGTFFPQEIGLAASFNREHATALGEVLAYETRAAMTPWVFSPVMDLGRDARWPRNWESWGEDALVHAEMSKAVVKAEQGENPNAIPQDKVAVCVKHYLAYGTPATGKDRTPGIVSPLDLREKYFAPFKACLEEGALSLMVNSASINGVPVHASYEYLTQWAKKDLNWDGLIVTDWADVNNLFVREHVAANRVEALALAINAGIDMVMEPYDAHAVEDIETAVNQGLLPISRVDDAVKRVLRIKYRLGLFENPSWDVSGFEVGSAAAHEKARKAALEAQVLLKNEGGILPLKEGAKILVTGPNGNSMRTLNGGWSYTWQGAESDEFAAGYNTIFEALAQRFGQGNVRYEAGVSYLPGNDWEAEDASGIAAAVAAARWADVVVACVGENSYCETPGNMNDLNLSVNQKNLVRGLAATGKPVVLIINEGRPRILGDIEPLAQAVVDIFLPGNFGGDALASLLAGDENFTAKMPFTYPKHINALHTYDYKVSENVSTMAGVYNYDARMDVQWDFGYGLSYTEFAYSDLAVSKTEFGPEEELEVSVKVTNTGKVAGKEAVLLYSSDLVASIVPDNRRLRAFEKVALQPGESTTVSFTLKASDLAFVGADGRWRLEEGDFRLACGSEVQMVHCNKTKVWNTPNI